jgi:hypothetical protein
MLDALIDQNQEAAIVRTQTTYLEVVVATRTFRIDYRDKVEFVIRTGTQGKLAHLREHPLLWDYNGPRDTVYLSGPAADPPALVEALHRTVATASQHWRTLERYLFGFNRANSLTLLEQNIADGSGLLLQGAPLPIVRAVVEVAHQHGAATYTLAPLPSEPIPVAAPYTVLFLDACYIIARDFKVQER